MASEGDEDPDCPICYRRLLPKLTVETACGHKFCIVCLTRWARDKVVFACPYCQGKVQTTQLEFDEEQGSLVFTSPWGQAYIQMPSAELGIASYHFVDERTAYISYDSDFARSHWRMTDGSEPPATKYFVDVEYDQETRRFRGTILWEGEVRLIERCGSWKYDFKFSEDFLKIESGTCEMLRENGTVFWSSDFVPTRNPDSERRELCYSLYIREKLMAILNKALKGICFSCYSEKDLVALPCKHTLCKICIKPYGQVGKWAKCCDLCESIFFFADLEIPGVLRKAITSPIGQVYAQDLGVGSASYHFAADGPYISYEKAPEGWKLDDGSRPPARKEFLNWNYEEQERKFTGEIRWEPVTFTGDNLWIYEFTFNEKFTEIESGFCKNFSPQFENGEFETTTISSKGPSSLHYILQEEPMLD